MQGCDAWFYRLSVMWKKVFLEMDDSRFSRGDYVVYGTGAGSV